MFKVALSRANVAGPPNKTKQSRVDSDAAQILASSPKDVLNSTVFSWCRAHSVILTRSLHTILAFSGLLCLQLLPAFQICVMSAWGSACRVLKFSVWSVCPHQMYVRQKIRFHVQKSRTWLTGSAFYLRYVIKISYLMLLILQWHLLKPRHPARLVGPSIRPYKTGNVLAGDLTAVKQQTGSCVVESRNDVTIKKTTTAPWQNHKYLSRNGPDLWRS